MVDPLDFSIGFLRLAQDYPEWLKARGPRGVINYFKRHPRSKLLPQNVRDEHGIEKPPRKPPTKPSVEIDEPAKPEKRGLFDRIFRKKPKPQSTSQPKKTPTTNISKAKIKSSHETTSKKAGNFVMDAVKSMGGLGYTRKDGTLDKDKIKSHFGNFIESGEDGAVTVNVEAMYRFVKKRAEKHGHGDNPNTIVKKFKSFAGEKKKPNDDDEPKPKPKTKT